jgi:ABC-type uncharacterized transport system involved in gliding motility auxiliary subunit
MPLTTRKLTHISAMYQKIFASRSQQVVLTMRTSIGGTTTLQAPGGDRFLCHCMRQH